MQTVVKPIERYFTLLVLREMQIKMIMSYHFTSNHKDDYIEKIYINKYWHGYIEIKTLLLCWWEYKMAQ